MGVESPPGRRLVRAWPVFVVVWLLGSNAACGGGSESETVAVPRVTPGTWAVLGSSTAAGVGAPADKGWVALVGAAQQLNGIVIGNLARSGLLTSQALPMSAPLTTGRAPPDPTANIDRALTMSPKLVILAFPTNDAMAGVPATETVGHWQLIRQRAAQSGATTLVLSTQPRDGLDAAQRAILDDTDRLAADGFGPCFVAVRAALSDAQGGIAPALSAGDGIHLNAEGHRVVSERVTAVLNGGRCVRLTD